ncbi:hypothetical protein [Deinococcus sp. 6GRE01]|nr:hypothetical protein [Deinococcus sp. 6GRE01]MCD0157125.1 hypothetical protein [Deinococcus sp. 6GRE01]
MPLNVQVVVPHAQDLTGREVLRSGLQSGAQTWPGRARHGQGQVRAEEVL